MEAALFEWAMGIIINTLVIITVILETSAVILLLFKEGLIEVNPMRAVVVKNIWTGKARALKAGMHLIIPGRDKKLLDITLENEPSDPQITKALTSEGIEIGVDWVITTQQVVEDNDEAIVNAGTKINYEKRRELIIDRIKVYLQNAVKDFALEQIILNSDKQQTQEKLKSLEDTINRSIEENIEKEWGIRVKIGIRNIELPAKAKEVAEEAATAEKEGERIHIKAKKAGVDPRFIVVGDIIYDIVRTLQETSGGKKRKKERREENDE